MKDRSYYNSLYTTLKRRWGLGCWAILVLLGALVWLFGVLLLTGKEARANPVDDAVGTGAGLVGEQSAAPAGEGSAAPSPSGGGGGGSNGGGGPASPSSGPAGGHGNGPAASGPAPTLGSTSGPSPSRLAGGPSRGSVPASTRSRPVAAPVGDLATGRTQVPGPIRGATNPITTAPGSTPPAPTHAPAPAPTIVGAEPVAPPVRQVAQSVGPATRPVAESVKPATKLLGRSVERTVEPVRQAAQPAVELVGKAADNPMVRPARKKVKSVLKPVRETVDPVLRPVRETVEPVRKKTIEPVVEPVREAAEPTVQPILPADEPVRGAVARHPIVPTAPEGRVVEVTSKPSPQPATTLAPRAESVLANDVPAPVTNKEEANSLGSSVLTVGQEVLEGFALRHVTQEAPAISSAILEAFADAQRLFESYLVGRSPPAIFDSSTMAGSVAGRAPLPFTSSTAPAAAGGASSVSGFGMGLLGVLAFLSILLLRGRFSWASLEFLKPNSALRLAIERPG